MTTDPAWVADFAPAKVNLTLHVTGRRADGYHLLDSLVVFADLGDRISLRPADQMSLTVTGPLAEGVPVDARNLCWRAALAFGQPVEMVLDKHLPHAAGIGGGSSDAAAVLRAMARAFGRDFAGGPAALGADVPVCLLARAARMRGVGEDVMPVALPPLHAVLVNPRVSVPTPQVFAAMTRRDNAPMPDLPQGDVLAWLADQRNDMQDAAITLAPVIGAVIDAIAATGARVARMSGSGATCFGLYDDAQAARGAAQMLAKQHPDWWVRDCVLG